MGRLMEVGVHSSGQKRSVAVSSKRGRITYTSRQEIQVSVHM